MKFLFFIVFTLTLYGHEMRGFVVEDPEGRLYLVDTPAIRSCCIQKGGRAVQLVGDFGKLSRLRVVTVNGTLSSDGLKLVADGFAEADLLAEKVSSD